MKVATRTGFIRAGLAAAVKAAALLAVAGCGFHPAGGDGDADAGADSAPGDPDAPPAIDAAADGTSARGFCDLADPTQRLCLTFAGGVLADGTSSGLAIQATEVGFGPGAVGDGLQVKSTSVVHVAETTALDIASALTMEAFVSVSAVTTTRAGVMDNNGQYGMWITPQLVPYCTLIGSTVTAPAALAADTWAHLACVYDGASFALYVDGALVAAVNRSADITTTGADGLNLGQDCTVNGAGDPLTGGLDEVRIWAAARSADEIAAAAARRAP